MRMIKFRVWNKKFTCWDNISSFDGDFNDIFEIDNTIFQQYTGLKDKNGKEIYEGDIVKGYYFDTDYMSDILVICPVNWNESTASFNVGCRYWTQKSIIVIGNIFENPDLIK